MSFWERYEKTALAIGLKPMAQDTADMFGATRASIASWKTKGIVPKGETVALIADAFHVSCDYLLGRTDDPSDVSAASSESRKVIPKAIRMYYELDGIDQAKVEAYLAGLLAADKYARAAETKNA